ncbi:MAG: hypothetical protein GY758_10420, partial [Fuerstiella sp.]|nr:hypothetical protein [Fuerstiella sp.]
EVFGNIVGQPFQVSMKSGGSITNVKIPPQLLSVVRKSQSDQPGGLTEKMLTDMMKQSAVMLPETPVSPDATWTNEQNVQMPFGTMTIISAMTYKEKDANGNAVIDFVPTVKITPGEGAATKVNLTGSDGKGRVIFDIARGRVNQTVLDLTLDMTVEVNEQLLPQRIHNVMSMKLVP